MTGEVGHFELRKAANLVYGCAGAGVFLAHDVFLSGEDQIDHADQVGLELRLVVGVAPRSVAAGAFDFSEDIRNRAARLPARHRRRPPDILSRRSGRPVSTRQSFR